MPPPAIDFLLPVKENMGRGTGICGGRLVRALEGREEPSLERTEEEEEDGAEDGERGKRMWQKQEKKAKMERG